MKYQIYPAENAEVSVRFVEYDAGPPGEVWSLEYDQSSGGPSPVELVQSLLGAAFTEEDGFPPFVLDRRQRYYEWGASGAIETVVLSVLGALVYDALKSTFQLLVEEVRLEQAEGISTAPITKDEAVERSRWRVQAIFGVDGDALDLHDVALSNDRWTVTLRGDRAEYEVRLASDRGYPIVTETAMTVLN